MSRSGHEPAQIPELRLLSNAAVPETTHSPPEFPADVLLPVPLTSFIGRVSEVAAISRLLQQENARLLSLTGPGGVGKSRLAIRAAAAAAAAFNDGVAFISLASVRASELVLPTIALALGLHDGDDLPALTRLTALLRNLNVLLILDNFEQVIAAGPDLGALLGACTRMTALVTSRAPLRVSGERVMKVTPLALPQEQAAPATFTPPSSIADLEAVEAVQLFVDRAQAAAGDFQLTADNAAAVAAICQRTDGLPLAIELAAARIRTLTPGELLTMFPSLLPLLTDGPVDQPARLRTMRDGIRWSYELLTPDEQRFFRTLSVFVGGFTLDAAEWVASGHRALPQPSTLDLLAALVDKSLVQRQLGLDQTRYGMLETVREFALEALAATGDDAATLDAHADWCLAFAAQAEPGLAGPDFAAWVDRVRAELGNVRAAHAWLFACGDAERALRLAGRLGWFWASGGYLQEGRALFDRLIAMPGATEARPELARALHAAGDVEQWLGNLDRAEAHFARALTIFRELGDARGVVAMLRGLGSVAVDRGDLERAEVLLREVLDRSPAAGTAWEAASAANVLGVIAYTRGDHAASLRYGEAAVAGWQSLDDTGHVPSAKINLARTALADGDPSRAAAVVRDVLADLTDAGGDLLVCDTFELVAGLALVTKDTTAAARSLAVADAAQRRLGNQRWPAMQRMFEQMTSLARQELGAPAFQIAWDSGASEPLAGAIAGALQTLDRVDAGLQQAVQARAETTLLTQREQEVLRLLVDGLSDKEIAAALGIGARTASTHVAAIRAKLDAPSRSAAAAIAVRGRLV